MKNYLLFETRASIRLPYLITLLLAFWLTTTSAQNVALSGTVYDAQGPLPGVNVSLKNTTTATFTAGNGTFQITAKAQDTLVFSSVGYVTFRTVVGLQTTFKITMQPDETALQEVIINAGYYKVKDKERTGSIAKITAKEIETQPVTNFLATMQGRMAGVNITQNSGVPGGGFEIQIRGLNSLRADGNAPLYIIDGIPYASDPIGYSSSGTIMPSKTSPLNSINPADIESIEILKDADATAIYGSRGANGVVLVTLKKGMQGKTQYNANISSGIGSVTRFMEMMNTQQYLTMRDEAYSNDGVEELPAWAYDVNGKWDRTRYTDWQKKLIGGTAQITNIYTAINGGNEATQFLVSGTFNRETTVFPGDFSYKKGNLRTSINHLSDNNKFKIGFSFGYNVQDNNQPSTDLTIEAIATPPNAPELYNTGGTLNWEDGTFTNPLRNLEGKSLFNTKDLISTLTLTYEVNKNLEFKTHFGLTDIKHTESSSYPSTIYNPSYGLGSEYSSIFKSQYNRSSWSIEPQMQWKINWSKFRINALAGVTFQSQSNDQLAQQAAGFISNSLIYNLAAATSIDILLDENTEYKYNALFSRVNFNFDGKYILNLTGRRDGSSRFGPGKQFSNFAAVGMAWILSKEKLFESIENIVSFAKLRASYGTSGSDQIGDYQYRDTYTITGSNYGGVVGIAPARLFNPNFAWETNKKLEFALEAGFIKDRLFLTASWFRNRSANQLVGTPLPGTTGFSSIQANLDAVVENSGFEFALRTTNLQGKKIKWFSSFNVTLPKNKLLSFPGLESSTYANTYVVGQPINSVKLFHYTGIDPQTGLYSFQDVNGDGNISAPDDRQTVKDLNSKFYGGFQNQIIYNQWDIDFLFQFVKQLNWNPSYTMNIPGLMGNQPAAAIDRWQNPTNTGSFQQYTNGANSEAFNTFTQMTASDGAISDASYVRLKNIAISYNMPPKWLRGMKCRFSLQAQNLLTFTSFKGADPEFRTSGYLPPLKVITTAIQLTF